MDERMRVLEMMEEGKSAEALERALQAMEGLDQNSGAYLDWLNIQGYLCCDLAEYEQALAVYDRYMELAREKKDAQSLHIGCHQKAMVLRLMGKYTQALDYIRREREIIAAHFPEDSLKLSVNGYEMGYLSYLLNRMEEAGALMAQCLTHALKTDDPVAQACAYRGMGEIHRKQGQTTQAELCFDKAYDLFLQAGDGIGADEVERIRTMEKA